MPQIYAALAKPRSPFPAIAAIHWIMVLAIVLRLMQLGSEGVWIDEMYSLEDATAFSFSLNRLGMRPFYYLLLRGWMVFGDSDVWLRSLSVLLDIGAIAIAYRLAAHTLGRPVARMTALVMALSPLMINHAQEIRMYSLITCLTLSGTLALVYALEKPTVMRMSGWAIARLLAILTSPLMVLLLLPDGLLYGLTYGRKWPQFKLWVYGLGFIGAAWSPLLLGKFLFVTENFVSDHAAWQAGSGGTDLVDILAKLPSFTVYAPLRSLKFSSEALPLFYYQLFTLVLLGVLGVALTALRPRLQSRLLWIAAWAFLPAVAQFAASEILLAGTIWHDRYLLYTAPYWIMLLAYGVHRMRHWQPLLISGIAGLYFIAVGGDLAYYYTSDYRPPWPQIAAAIPNSKI